MTIFHEVVPMESKDKHPKLEQIKVVFPSIQHAPFRYLTHLFFLIL